MMTPADNVGARMVIVK